MWGRGKREEGKGKREKGKGKREEGKENPNSLNNHQGLNLRTSVPQLLSHLIPKHQLPVKTIQQNNTIRSDFTG